MRCRYCKNETNTSQLIYKLQKGFCQNCYNVVKELQDIINRLDNLSCNDVISEDDEICITSSKNNLELLLDKFMISM